MKVLGFEIKRAQQAAEPQKKPETELGDSGTEKYVGIIREEYVKELTNEQGVKKYDEMRKSDGTVRAAIVVTQLPIRRAEWFVTPASEDDKDQEIAEFVKKNLFEWQRMGWDDLLRQALLNLTFGVMPFEKVFDVKDWEGRSYIISQLAPRLPKTIMSWELDDGTEGIQQQRRDGETAQIPMEKMVVFINEREGDNYWGTSILRSAYRHWYHKSNFYNIDAIAFERQGVGVPYAKMPSGATDKDEKDAKNLLENLRANEKAYILEPHNYEVGFKDMGGKQLRDPSPSIKHHDRQITKAVLAQFLELGGGESGSYALSKDQSDLFLQSMEAVANEIADTFNKEYIRELVDLNFDNVENYPTLDYSGISSTDVKGLAEAYQTLTNAGGIRRTPDDEQYFRGMLGLPEVTEEEKERREEEKPDMTPKEPEEEPEKETEDELGLSELKKNKKINRHDIGVRIKEKVDGMRMSESIDFLRKHIENIEKAAEQDEFYKQVKGALTARLKEREREIFQETNDFKSWRPLTFAEKKVSFQSIRDKLDEAEEGFKEEAEKLLEEEKERYVSKVGKAIMDADKDKIKKTEFMCKTDYLKLIKKYLKEIYVFGKNNAAREMGEDTPPNKRDTLRNIDIAADTIVEDHLHTFQTKAKQAIVESIRKPDEKEEYSEEEKKKIFKENKSRAIAAMGAALTKGISDKVGNTAAIIMGGYLNRGREDTFEKYEDKIHALQRSEILDKKTCDYCLSVDGRVVEKDDPFASHTVFHSNCRGIWVEILKTEEELPRIDGVPKTLRDRIDDAPNTLIQPRKPTTRKGTPAGDFVRKKKKE